MVNVWGGECLGGERLTIHIFYSPTLLNFGDKSVWIFLKQHFGETNQTEKFGSFVGVLATLSIIFHVLTLFFKGWCKVVKVDTSPPPPPPSPPPPSSPPLPLPAPPQPSLLLALCMFALSTSHLRKSRACNFIKSN